MCNIYQTAPEAKKIKSWVPPSLNVLHLPEITFSVKRTDRQQNYKK